MTNLLGSNERQEHIEGDLNTVDKDKSVLSGDELEVDSMDNGPDLPRSLACREQVILDLVSNGSEGVTVDQTKVSEEDGHENRAPNDLIEGDLHGNSLSIRSWDCFVQPVVEVVARRSMVQETKGRKGKESLEIEGSSRNEDLSQEVTKSPSNQGSASLGGKRILIQSIVVGSPSRNSSSADLHRVTKEGASDRRVLAEDRRRLVQSTGSLLLGAVRGNAKGGGDRKETKERKKLHCCFLSLVVDFG